MSYSYPHNPDVAAKFASEAFSRLQKEGLPPVPDNFELFYVYYARLSQDITKAIDFIIASGGRITEEKCQELFERYLSKDRTDEAVRRAGDQIQATIKDVSHMVHDVQSATSEFSVSLSQVKSNILKADSKEDLERIVHGIVADTTKMLDQNKGLEEQLTLSAKMMEALQRDLEIARRQALTDGLTGIANRKAFDNEMRRVAEECKENKSTFTLLMVDIDHFKSFNDNYGHQVGDQVLRLVAKTLTDGIKGKDTAARYGGEEFSIILPETPIEAGVAVANTLRKAIAGKDVINRSTGEKLGRITMSAGVAQFNGSETIEDMIERADAALYAAKHNGRNQVASAPPTTTKVKTTKV